MSSAIRLLLADVDGTLVTPDKALTGPEVQRSARRVTTANTDEGFANAVERFILPRS